MKGLDQRNLEIQVLPKSFNGSKILRFLPLAQLAFLFFFLKTAFPFCSPLFASVGSKVLRAEQQLPFMIHVYNASHNGTLIS